MLNIVLFTLPAYLFLTGLMGTVTGTMQTGAAIPLFTCPLYCTGIQYIVRQQLNADGRITDKMWWSQPFGSILLVSVALLSLFKGLTGIGWTWKGRPLRMPEVAAREQEKKADAAPAEESKKDQ